MGRPYLLEIVQISLLLVKLRKLNTEVTHMTPLSSAEVRHSNPSRWHKCVNRGSKIIRTIGPTANWKVPCSLLGFQNSDKTHWLVIFS